MNVIMQKIKPSVKNSGVKTKQRKQRNIDVMRKHQAYKINNINDLKVWPYIYFLILDVDSLVSFHMIVFTLFTFLA